MKKDKPVHVYGKRLHEEAVNFVNSNAIGSSLLFEFESHDTYSFAVGYVVPDHTYFRVEGAKAFHTTVTGAMSRLREYASHARYRERQGNGSWGFVPREPQIDFRNDCQGFGEGKALSVVPACFKGTHQRFRRFNQGLQGVLEKRDYKKSLEIPPEFKDEKETYVFEPSLQVLPEELISIAREARFGESVILQNVGSDYSYSLATLIPFARFTHEGVVERILNSFTSRMTSINGRKHFLDRREGLGDLRTFKSPIVSENGNINCSRIIGVRQDPRISADRGYAIIPLPVKQDLRDARDFAFFLEKEQQDNLIETLYEEFNGRTYSPVEPRQESEVTRRDFISILSNMAQIREKEAAYQRPQDSLRFKPWDFEQGRKAEFRVEDLEDKSFEEAARSLKRRSRC